MVMDAALCPSTYPMDGSHCYWDASANMCMTTMHHSPPPTPLYACSMVMDIMWPIVRRVKQWLQR